MRYVEDTINDIPFTSTPRSPVQFDQDSIQTFLEKPHLVKQNTYVTNAPWQHPNVGLHVVYEYLVSKHSTRDDEITLTT